MSAGPCGREGRLGLRSQLHGKKEGAGPQCVCEKGRDSKGCATCMTPGTSAPELLKPLVLPLSKGRLPASPSLGGRVPTLGRGRRAKLLSDQRRATTSRLPPPESLLQVWAKTGLGFPGHTWNSHGEKGFILLLQWGRKRSRSSQQKQEISLIPVSSLSIGIC